MSTFRTGARHVAYVEADSESMRCGGSSRTAACVCGWRGPERATLEMVVDDALMHEREGHQSGAKSMPRMTVDTITDDQIRDLFAKHCECRPLNTARTHHSHDCDDDATEACRAALHGFIVEEGGWPVAVGDEERRTARAHCAFRLSSLPTYQDYVPDGCP